ncbi:MAG TPA: 3-oxoacyl-ACP reductase FabG [Desulfotignum sp.]|jgi:3-oxoacyl-[acyl-carrier protein] reductase|nr:3-oxoacyl-ACP reductase FabG [Desulfotignum sp.]
MNTSFAQTALVTGASRGIGRAIALNLAGNGIFVFVNYRSDENGAQKTLADIRCRNGRAALVRFDVTSQSQCDDAVKAIIAQQGRLDILVNNAGIREDRLFAMMKQPAWETVLKTHLDGFYHVTRPVVRQMLRQRSGRIVNISSAAGQTGNAGQVNYSAAKAGINGATKALAREIGSRGITVNAVAPGFIETDMLSGLDPDKIKKEIPAGRLGQPEDVAAVVSFLCSDGAAYVNGQIIGVNGGLI